MLTVILYIFWSGLGLWIAIAFGIAASSRRRWRRMHASSELKEEWRRQIASGATSKRLDEWLKDHPTADEKGGEPH